MNIVDRAVVYAATAHGEISQRRHYTNEPYIVHPLEVLRLVTEAGAGEATQAAGALHDVVEDCDRTGADIHKHFGNEIAGLVFCLTDHEDASLTRAQRKAIDRERLAHSPPQAQTIKLADLVSNIESIVEHDPKFAATYMREKAALLDVLTRGDRRLMQIARSHLNEHLSR